jgi:hypothetical protein
VTNVGWGVRISANFAVVRQTGHTQLRLGGVNRVGDWSYLGAEPVELRTSTPSAVMTMAPAHDVGSKPCRCPIVCVVARICESDRNLSVERLALRILGTLRCHHERAPQKARQVVHSCLKSPAREISDEPAIKSTAGVSLAEACS